MTNSTRWILQGVFVALWCLASGATAQAQVIDLFENQDRLDAAPIEIGTADGPLTPPADGAGDEAGDTPPPIAIEAADRPAVQIERSGASANAGRTDGGLQVKFVRRGGPSGSGGLLVPARVQGRKVYFVVDTGATYTAVSGSFARTAGITPPSGAPSALFHTANGQIHAQFGVIGRLELGGRTHHRVTYIVCDACEWPALDGVPVVGLLGLNVLRRYRMSVDESQGILELVPHADYQNRRYDIEPWLQAQPARMQVARGPGGRSVPLVVLSVRNLAPHTVDELRFALHCRTLDGTPFKAYVTVSRLAAQSSKNASLDTPLGGCLEPEIGLDRATW